MRTGEDRREINVNPLAHNRFLGVLGCQLDAYTKENVNKLATTKHTNNFPTSIWTFRRNRWIRRNNKPNSSQTK